MRPLPDRVAQLLRNLGAPPRLAAHLRAVHDVACQLVDWVADRYPALRVDCDAVLFGAATHDIGKIAHIAELSRPGSVHEEAGRELLLAQGISPELARFAGTHAAWTRPDIEIEDLIVTRLAQASGRPAWEEFLAFDDLLTSVGYDASQPLALQASYPVQDLH